MPIDDAIREVHAAGKRLNHLLEKPCGRWLASVGDDLGVGWGEEASACLAIQSALKNYYQWPRPENLKIESRTPHISILEDLLS